MQPNGSGMKNNNLAVHKPPYQPLKQLLLLRIYKRSQRNPNPVPRAEVCSSQRTPLWFAMVSSDGWSASLLCLRSDGRGEADGEQGKKIVQQRDSSGPVQKQTTQPITTKSQLHTDIAPCYPSLTASRKSQRPVVVRYPSKETNKQTDADTPGAETEPGNNWN